MALSRSVDIVVCQNADVVDTRKTACGCTTGGTVTRQGSVCAIVVDLQNPCSGCGVLDNIGRDVGQTGPVDGDFQATRNVFKRLTTSCDVVIVDASEGHAIAVALCNTGCRREREGRGPRRDGFTGEASTGCCGCATIDRILRRCIRRAQVHFDIRECAGRCDGDRIGGDRRSDVLDTRSVERRGNAGRDRSGGVTRSSRRERNRFACNLKIVGV